MKTTKMLTMLALLLVLATSAVGNTQGKMYWTEAGTDKIQRANLDGSAGEDLVTGLSNPSGIALDVSGGKMYWADYNTGKIQRANLDGSTVEDLVTGLSGPSGVTLDVAGAKMYWTDIVTDKIQRANLDGSGVEDLVVTGLTTPYGITLDAAGGKMYWTDYGAGKIKRANLNGSVVEDLVTGLSGLIGITLDVTGGKMYWTNIVANKIQRANLDGTGVVDIITGLQFPYGIALDTASGKMYWTDYGTDKIQRANLDGSAVEDLVTGLSDPRGIALIPSPREAFSYQGRLIDSNNVADGLYDLRFKLFDFDVAGHQVGSDVNKPDVDIIDGYFTVEIDFGDVFNGDGRWLQIGVRPGASTGSFTTLNPRQEVLPSPYAMYAKKAGYAETAGGTAGGIVPTDITNWNTAFGWGDHSGAGYLTSYTETDPIFAVSTAGGIVPTDITNWNTAYSWGDHSTSGYLTSESDPQVGTISSNYVPKWNGSALVTGTIFDNGNVGIGITSPSEVLDVNGNININSVYKIAGDTVLSVTSTYDTLVGIDAGANTTSNSNTFVGYRTGFFNITGNRNSAMGTYALYSNTFGNYNSAMGYRALADSNTGSYNSAIGYQALRSNTTGYSNSAVGYLTLWSNTDGNFNSAVGREAGRNSTGSGNVFLGYQAGYNETGSDKLYIDNSNTSTPLIYGDFFDNRVGINRVAIANTLEVGGSASKAIAGDWLANSDARIKADIQTVTNALETLDKVRLVSFKYTDDYQASHPSIEKRRYLNVIAQEFREVFPEYVKSSKEKLPDGEEILQVDAYPLTVYSAAAVQELHAMAKDKDAEIAALKDRLSKLETMMAKFASAQEGWGL